ncbi:pantoate--beta-alanine ligase [Bradyrhizobium sp. PMVTL-01]|uniref:pantoate--beta-alanine ligase n=1 Tax=Bradyrhizobium sp. PMVTL-01 TaxID=3434999 RepID=UPI003F701880
MRCERRHRSKPLLNLANLVRPLCGALRPGHFRVVATVGCKLFNMVQPDVVFWPEGVSAMHSRASHVVDLNLPIEIVTVPNGSRRGWARHE